MPGTDVIPFERHGVTLPDPLSLRVEEWPGGDVLSVIVTGPLGAVELQVRPNQLSWPGGGMSVEHHSHQPRPGADTARTDCPALDGTRVEGTTVILMSRPGAALGDRLDRALLAVDTAQEHLYDARMADVARIVRDALPTALGLVIDTNDLYIPPIGVVLHSIYAWGGVEVWVRDRALPEALAAYRTSEGTAWPAVVRHLEQELTNAMGAESPGVWWEPREDRGDDGFYFARLPSAEDVAAIQAENPRTLAAYIADRDALPFAGLWHAAPVAHPTMSVAGVAITASLADDGVFTVDIDPTATPPQVMPPAGAGTPVRIRLAQTAIPSPDPAPGTTEPDGPLPEPAPSRTDGCEADSDDGETAGLGQDGQPIGVSDAVPIGYAPTPIEPISDIRGLDEVLDWFDGDGDMRYVLAADDIAHDNGRRAGFGMTALLAYARRAGHLDDSYAEKPELALGELLGDLRHLADALGLDYTEIDEDGLGHYKAELRGGL